MRDMMKINSIMKKFRQRFKLSDSSLDQLRDFFTFKKNYEKKDHIKELKYNLLLECDNLDVGENFIQEVTESLKNLQLLKKGSVTAFELELSKNMPD